MKTPMKILTRSSIIALSAAAALTVAGCGNSQGDRALSGAGIGAGAGALGTAVTGGNPAAGAIIGGAAGAAVGAFTDDDDVNLGKPIWE